MTRPDSPTHIFVMERPPWVPQHSELALTHLMRRACGGGFHESLQAKAGNLQEEAIPVSPRSLCLTSAVLDILNACLQKLSGTWWLSHQKNVWNTSVFIKVKVSPYESSFLTVRWNFCSLCHYSPPTSADGAVLTIHQPRLLPCWLSCLTIVLICRLKVGLPSNLFPPQRNRKREVQCESICQQARQWWHKSFPLTGKT